MATRVWMKTKNRKVGHLGNKQKFGSPFTAIIRNFEFHFIFISRLIISLRKWRISKQVAEIQRLRILQMSRAQVSSVFSFMFGYREAEGN